MKLLKKRLLPLLLALCLGLVACGGSGVETESQTEPQSTETEADTETEAVTEPEAPAETESKEEEPVPQMKSLDGKSIIFIGNSYTYYGQTVLEKSQKYLTQEERVNDTGYFYQLCKANGMDVKVTNWTFGGHGLEHLFGGNCSANRGCDGEDHKAYLVDRNYDYVVIQAGSGEISSNSIMSDVYTIMDFFREANPNAQFVLLVPYAAYGTIGATPTLQKKLLNSLKLLANEGVTIVDWGGLVMDILNGDVAVPGSKQVYEKNTFVISKSAKDGYHPNQLSGYITTTMTYCALTGASAMNQPYSFCGNTSLRKSGMGYFFNFTKFVEKFYTYDGATTNYPEILRSKVDMDGIRTLIDKHLAAKAYMDYRY